MKTEYKIEDGLLKIAVSEEIAMDKDGDGVASLRGSVGANIEINGIELVDELVKSSELVAEIKAKLGL